MAFQAPNTGFGDATPDWLKGLPSFAPPVNPAPVQPQGNPLVAGFSSGLHQLYGDVGGLAQAAGTAVGLQPVADWGKSVADSQRALSSQRPDLEFGGGEEGLPWYSPSKLGYNVAKAIPGIGGAIAAGAAVPEAAVPAWLARIGEAAPGIIGGGAGLGRAFGKSIIGAGAAFLPGAVAGNVSTEEEANHGAPLTREQAVAAIGLGVPEAAIGGMFPASLGKGGGAGLGAKILRGAMAGGSVNAVQSGLSTGLSDFLGDPDMPIAQRAQHVVQSALQGGVIGSIFGGAFGPFHGGEPVNEKPVGDVTAPDLEQSTAFLAQPSGTQGELGLDQNRQTATAGGPVQPPSSLRDVATPDLVSQFSDLAKKGNDRTASENAYHTILGQELAARTAPGVEPGQGTLFTPAQMGEREPLIQALKAKVVPESASSNNPFVQGFNASTEPELINSLKQGLTAASPKWLKDLGTQYGVKADGSAADIVGALNDLNTKFEDLSNKRQAAAKVGDQKKFAAINTQISRTKDAITKAEGLIKLHQQAGDLITPPSELGPDGQVNLPGLGVASPGLPSARDTGQLDLFNPAQAEALTPQETGARQEAQRQFQAKVAPGLPEGTLQAHDMPSLVRDLTAHIAAYDEAGTGPKQWDPQIRKLAEQTGLIDSAGTPRDLKTERQGLYDKYEALWKQAGDKRDLTQTDQTRASAAEQAQALKAPGGSIDQVEKLQDLHAQAGQDQPIDVPGRVRPVYAKTWKTLEAAKGLRADDQETNARIVKIADNAQKAIETNSKTAEQSGQFALNQISNLVREKASSEIEGRPNNPTPQSPLDLGKPGEVKVANKNRETKPAIDDATTKRQFDKLSKKVTGDIATRTAEIKNPAETETFKAALEPEPVKVAPVKRQTGRVLPDLTEQPAINPDTLEAKIRAAHNEITGGALNGVSELKDLRPKLADIPRDVLDKELARLHEDPNSGMQIGRSDSPAERSADRDVAGLAYKGELAHQLVANPRLQQEPVPPVKTVAAVTDPVKAKAELEALHQAEPEGSPSKEFMAKALLSRDPSKWKSALSAMQIAKGFFRDEGGSLNIQKAIRSFSKLTGRAQQDVANKAAEPMTKPVKASDMAENRPTTSPAQAEGRIQDAQGVASLAMHNLSDVVRDAGSSAPVAFRKMALIAESRTGIVKLAGKYLKTSGPYRDMHEKIEAISSAKSKPDILTARAFNSAKSELREMANEVLYRLNDGSGLDIRKNLDRSSLLDDKGKLVPNAAELTARHKEGMALVSRLRQAGGMPLVDNHLAMMQTKGYQEVAALLSRFGGVWSKKNEGTILAGHETNPDEDYQFSSGLHDSPEGTRAFYAKRALDMKRGIEAEIDKRAKAAAEFLKTDPKKAKAMAGDAADLKSMLKYADDRLKEIGIGTYSPLGHGDGDYFVAGKIKTDENGNQRPGSMAAVQKAFEAAGYHNIGFFHDSDNGTIMTKFDTRAKMNRVSELMKELEARGHLTVGETKNGYVDTPGAMKGVAPKFMESMIEDISQAVDSSGAEVDQAAAIKGRLISQLMDNLPGHSIIPNLQKREYVSGFSKEMGETAIHRAINSSRSSTNTSMAAQMTAAMTAMRAEVNAQKSDPTMTPKEKLIGADAHRELMLREAQKDWHLPHDFTDTIRAVTHTVGIGANIGYTILPMSQIFTLSHGELAKKYGNVAAAKALATSANEAFKIVTAVAKSPDRTSFGLRESTLKAAGISPGAIKTIMRLDNMGGINSQTRYMTDLGEGANSGHAKFVGYANMLGSYAEMYPRIITALAGAKLHDSNPGKARMTRDEYVKNVVDESQLRWGPGEASRLTGGKGPLGSFGKLAFAFTQFKTKMIEKLVSEVHDVISGDNPANTRAEAGRFLVSHLVATVALAGTLGLPAASMIAGVVDKLYTGLTGDETMDVEGAYRTWLAHTYGGNVADVLAKGLPRALGVDLSRLGEQKLLPFSELVQDKRKFEDVTEDWFRSMAGAAVGELGDAYLGLRDIANGDYMLGLQKALPGSLKDAVEATYLSQHGFVNRQGQKEPIPATTQAIIEKAMGIKTADEAKYDEASKIASGLKEQRQYVSQNISTHLNRAFMMQDSAGLNTWLNAAIQFQRSNPLVPGPLTSFGRSLQQKEMGQSMSNAFDMPLGLKPYDPIASRLGFLQQ